MMWKRLHNARAAKQQFLNSDPSPVDNVLETDSPHDAHGIVNRELLPQERQIHLSKATKEDQEASRLPKLLSLSRTLDSRSHLAVPSFSARQEGNWRPASSVYSQPSPPAKTSFPPPIHIQDRYLPVHSKEEVSSLGFPKSYPSFISSQSNQYDEDQASLLGDMLDIAALRVADGSSSQRVGSALSRTRALDSGIKRNQFMAAAAKFVRRKGEEHNRRQAVDPRWDPYSGEITTSEQGKPQSVKPRQFGIALRPVKGGAGHGNEVPVKTAVGGRMRQLEVSASIERPERNGAARRISNPPPMMENVDIQSLNMLQESGEEVESGTIDLDVLSGDPLDDSKVAADGTVLAGNVDPGIPHMQSDQQASTSVGDVRDEVFSDSHDIPTSAAALTLFKRALTPPQSIDHGQSRQNEPSPSSTMEQNFRTYSQESFPNTTDNQIQPISCFSVSSAPSEANTTPRSSSDSWDTSSPLPTYPPTEPSPVISRKRPNFAISGKSQIIRKAAAPSSPVFIRVARMDSRRSNNSKSLPLTPAEHASDDLITTLQAHLDDLAHRRRNITNSIRQMTELMPQDRLTNNDHVRVKREREKRKLDRLRIEEADIRREEHEVGLRLHRAWKRRDLDTVYEPTGLWVRRVTG